MEGGILILQMRKRGQRWCFALDTQQISKWLPEPRLKNLLTSVVVDFSPQPSCNPDTEWHSDDHTLDLKTHRCERAAL